MYEKNKKIKLCFSIRDNFGHEYVYKSSEKIDDEYDFYDVFYLIKAFKKFLINAGYGLGIANRVTYKGLTEEDKERIEL